MTSWLIRLLFPTACTSGDILTGSSGFFASPNFPNNFPQYSRCIWNITVPCGYIIKLTFHHFELHRYYYNRATLVTITNVASDDSRQPFQLYGQSVPSPVYSAGNSIQVIFTTLTEQYSGFNASYTAITYESGEPPSICFFLFITVIVWVVTKLCWCVEMKSTSCRRHLRNRYKHHQSIGYAVYIHCDW